MHQYRCLLVMTTLSYAAMYGLMYSMVSGIDSVYLNINNAYMAGLVAAEMLVIELQVMRSMYRNRLLYALLVVAGIAALAILWLFTREQTAVQDHQFLRSMIPHHSGAIPMCRQQREIDQMKDLLSRLDQPRGTP